MAAVSPGEEIVDPTTLDQLRSIVRRLQDSNADGTSLPEVVKLAQEVRMRSGITVDFDATPDLGEPLVVLRVPAEPPQLAATLQGLTPREREVATLIAHGLSNKEIAVRLGITLGTVKHYVHQMLEKTGLHSRVAIATEAKAR